MTVQDVFQRTSPIEPIAPCLSSAIAPPGAPPITDELDVVYGALEALEENAARVGLIVTYHTDFDEFVRLRTLAPDGVVNPMLNPRFSKLDRKAFWLKATARDGTLAALVGAKVFRTDDFMALVRSERLWYDRSPVHEIDARARPLPAFDRFGGTISHGAGAWTAPQFRVRGVTAFMVDYSRALLVKNHGIDWHTVTTIPKYLGVFARGLGYTVAPLYDGWCTMMGAEVELYLGRITRADIVERLGTPSELPFNWAEVPAPAAAAG
jgi:hypothetical protein